MEYFWFTIGMLVGCVLTIAVFGWLLHEAPARKEAINLTAWALIQTVRRGKTTPFMEVRK